MKQLRRDQKPDAQAFDEVRIITVPRFKESELSGDEWRISALTQFYRKGEVVHETDARNIETAIRLIGYHFLEACDNAKGFFAGEGSYCDQEGCKELATTTLEKTHEGCGQCGTVKPTEYSRPYRKFCDRHKQRGDSCLDDQDAIYIDISNEVKP